MNFNHGPRHLTHNVVLRFLQVKALENKQPDIAGHDDIYLQSVRSHPLQQDCWASVLVNINLFSKLKHPIPDQSEIKMTTQLFKGPDASVQTKLADRSAVYEHRLDLAI